VTDARGQVEGFDQVVLAVHAPDALALLGKQATPAEQHILGAHTYSSRYAGWGPGIQLHARCC
jgi:predicted NAD/FAD-binding protein